MLLNNWPGDDPCIIIQHAHCTSKTNPDHITHCVGVQPDCAYHCLVCFTVGDERFIIACGMLTIANSRHLLGYLAIELLLEHACVTLHETRLANTNSASLVECMGGCRFICNRNAHTHAYSPSEHLAGTVSREIDLYCSFCHANLYPVPNMAVFHVCCTQYPQTNQMVHGYQIDWTRSN